MANTTSAAIANTQIYNDSVLRGFIATIAPLRSFSFDASPAPATKGQTINMTFVPSGSYVQTWNSSTGYVVTGSTRQGIAVALSNHKFVMSQLSDEEIANSPLVRLEDAAYADGAELGLAVLQDIVSAISGSNFSNGYNVNSSSLWNVDALTAVRKVASKLKWGATRNVVLNPNAVYGLYTADDDLKFSIRGQSDVTTTGVIKNVFGWNNVYEANGYPTTLVSGSNTQVGFAATPDALCIAMRYLVPGPGSEAVIRATPLTEANSGITIGQRVWYDPNMGVSKNVYECVWGKAVGNANAAINLTSTVDV